MYFEWFIFLLNQNMLVKLFNEFDIFELSLISNIHEWLTSMDVNDCHGDGVVHWVK
jgi:hypothetical protein